MIDIGQIAPNQSPPPSAGLPTAVMRHIDRIVNLVAHKDLVQRRILAFLVGHAPLSYSVGQIAAWTDCARGGARELLAP